MSFSNLIFSKANASKRLQLCISALAGTIALGSLPLHSIGAPGEINSTNVGRNVRGGTYYNTPRGKTTFTSRSGGLWIKRGVEVRGLESDSAGRPTGNGGTMHFSAPGQGIRVDGNINVNAALGENGAYIGNGGRVFIDAKYVYQSGNIFANGLNGGLVQFNVGSLTMAPGAAIEARGFGGQGGNVNINASGVVDVQRGSIIDVSGKVAGTYDMNVINIEGGLVNIEGVLKANGIDADGEASRGGTIRLVATGQSNADCVDCAMSASNIPDDPMFTAEEMGAINARTADLIAAHDGSVVIGSEAIVQANGSAAPVTLRQSCGSEQFRFGDDHEGNSSESVTAGDGGTIIMSAIKDVKNAGQVTADGGDGFILLGEEVSDARVLNDDGPSPSAVQYDEGRHIVVNGGNGGTVVMTALGTIENTGLISADGGNGAIASSHSGVSNINNDSTRGPNYNWERSSVQDFSRIESGDGGQGGVLAFGYGNQMINEGTLSAKGGQGGEGLAASANDSETASGNDRYAFAQAEAYGGEGGDGGDGGLIVFSGTSNPIGEGSINVSGGLGGRGGNASATADTEAPIQGPSYGRSRNNNPSSAYSRAISEGGEGGRGGESGVIVTPDPRGLQLGSQNLISLSGGRGDYGDANTYSEGTANRVDLRNTSNDHTESSVGSSSRSLTVLVDIDPYRGRQVTDLNLDRTRANELITHQDNLILLSADLPEEESGCHYPNRFFNASVGGPFGSDTLLSTLFDQAIVRSVEDPLGRGDAMEEVNDRMRMGSDWYNSNRIYPTDNYRNFIVMNGNTSPLHIDTPTSLGRGEYDINFHTTNTLTFLSAGDIFNNTDTTWQAGNPTDWYKVGHRTYEQVQSYNRSGGKISILAGGSLVNEGTISTTGWLSGGSVNMAAANGDLLNQNDGQIFTNSNDSSAYHWIGRREGENGYWNAYSYYENYGSGSFSGGAVTLKASHDIINGERYTEDYYNERNFNEDYEDDGPSEEPSYYSLGRGYIGSNGGWSGGTIQMASGHNIVNLGTVEANAWFYFEGEESNSNDLNFSNEIFDDYPSVEPETPSYFNPTALGGNIYSNAGNINANLGTYSASAGGFGDRVQKISLFEEDEYTPQPGNGYGGFIHLHGDDAAINVDLSNYDSQYRQYEYSSYGKLKATGSLDGGTVLMTAGGTRGDGQGVPDEVLTGYPLSISGQSIAQGHGPVFGLTLPDLPLNIPGIAYNLSSIDTRGINQDGFIGIGGTSRAGAGEYSRFNNIAFSGDLNLLATAIEGQRNGKLLMAAGEGAVEAIACNGELPANPVTSPPSVTPPEETPIGNPTSTPGIPTPPGQLNFNLLGLFQEQRVIPNTQLPNNNTVPLIGYNEPIMFYAEEYLQVSENILENALDKYHEALTNGASDTEAFKTAILYLLDAGMDSNAAKEVLTKIEDGTMTADAMVVKLLQDIAGKQGKPEDEFAL